MKNIAFMINGGAGRVIASIPALRKYARLNPTTDFRILMPAWEELLYGDEILQPKVFNVNQKGIFDSVMKNYEIVNPEPYFNHEYINQQASLAEAFDKIINCTSDHSDLDYHTITVSEREREFIDSILAEAKTKSGKQKTIVIQPFGSAATVMNMKIVDDSARSLKHTTYLDICRRLAPDFNLVFFGINNIAVPDDNYTLKYFEFNPDLRFYAALISLSDYFLGVDSVGQHMARAFDKPGLVIMGGTFEKNVSYPDHFKFYRNEHRATYCPIRLSDSECNFANNLNQKTMLFSDRDVDNIVGIVRKDLL
jgi:hypothetical protein